MRGPLPYIGGKRAVAKTIVDALPEHRTYCEPFAGGAQVFFAKAPSRVEVLNDLDGDLVNFFRVCKEHYEELVRYMRFTVVSRRWYDILRSARPETLTDIQRAARRLYLQKNSYAGRVDRQNLRTGVVQPPSFDPKRTPDYSPVRSRSDVSGCSCSQTLHEGCTPFAPPLPELRRSFSGLPSSVKHRGRNSLGPYGAARRERPLNHYSSHTHEVLQQMRDDHCGRTAVLLEVRLYV